MSESKQAREAYRDIPSVDEILSSIKPEIFDIPYVLIKQVVRKCLSDIRKGINSGNIPNNISGYILKQVKKKLVVINNQSLQNVINGTGIILHTGLGRAPISESIFSNLKKNLSGYTSVELDLLTGKRGERTTFSNTLLNALTGSEASLVVNNNAAAVLIMLNTLAENYEIIISRGQQIEIGGSFRIPDVIRKSYCKMIEVGTTNRTHLRDYSDAINNKTGAILVAHTSNYKIEGFTKEVEIKDLAKLCRKKRIPLIVDLGSGALADFQKMDIHQDPLVKKILKEGANLVSFSGDKLLGGPQAGIICGKKNLINKIHQNPLYRSLRCDKIIISLLEETLRGYYTPDLIPNNNQTHLLFSRTQEDLTKFGKKIIASLDKQLIKFWGIKVISTEVEAGSGSLPTEKIRSAAIEFTTPPITASNLGKKFRESKVPVIGYIKRNRFRIDLKAVLDFQFLKLKEIIQNIIR